MIENNSPLDHPPISDKGFKKARLAGTLAALILTTLIMAVSGCRICCNGNPTVKHYNARNLTNK